MRKLLKYLAFGLAVLVVLAGVGYLVYQAPFLIREQRARSLIAALARQVKIEEDEQGVPMALVPAGSFMMGSENGGSNERPVHEVYLDEYYIDLYEVTNEQYAECAADGSCEIPGCSFYEDDGYADHPVVCVDWYAASDYCEWRGGRLPTEAEWEKAARGGLEGWKYPWGDAPPTCRDGAENGAQYPGCSGQTVPAGTFSPNGYGLYDMAGNAWEWVADWYGRDYYDNSPPENPKGPPSGEYRVLRGGSWIYYPYFGVRTAIRFWYFPVVMYNYIGFRCARTP